VKLWATGEELKTTRIFYVYSRRAVAEAGFEWSKAGAAVRGEFERLLNEARSSGKLIETPELTTARDAFNAARHAVSVRHGITSWKEADEAFGY
jgi:hypothetical protein